MFMNVSIWRVFVFVTLVPTVILLIPTSIVKWHCRNSFITNVSQLCDQLWCSALWCYISPECLRLVSLRSDLSDRAAQVMTAACCLECTVQIDTALATWWPGVVAAQLSTLSDSLRSKSVHSGHLDVFSPCCFLRFLRGLLRVALTVSLGDRQLCCQSVTEGFTGVW